MKRMIALVLVLVLMAAPLSAQGAEARNRDPRMSLTFDGTTAICDVTAYGNSLTDSVQITVRLWRGSTVCLTTWGASGTGKASLSETKTVWPGYTYTLTMDVVINGVIYPREYLSASC